MLSCFFCCSVTKNRTLIFPLSLSSLLDANNNNNNNNNLLEEGGCGFSTKDQQHFFRSWTHSSKQQFSENDHALILQQMSKNMLAYSDYISKYISSKDCQNFWLT